MPAVAGDAPAEAFEHRAYPVRILGKLFRGVLNIVSAPAELVTNPIKEAGRAQDRGGSYGQTVLGYGVGTVTGVVYTVARVGVGVVDILTFPIPTRPLMQPEIPATTLEILDDRAHANGQATTARR